VTRNVFIMKVRIKGGSAQIVSELLDHNKSQINVVSS